MAVQEILIHDDRTGPLLPALFSLHMTFGAAYTGREVAEWLRGSGFVEVQVRPLAGYSWLNALIVGVKPL